MNNKEQPAFATPRRKTARISTGSRPPPIRPRVSKLVDTEAEEASEGSASEKSSRYEGSFINDEQDSDGEARITRSKAKSGAAKSKVTRHAGPASPATKLGDQASDAQRKLRTVFLTAQKPSGEP
ncbi:hypothetical protein R3P38DRAFT_2800185 [Favolaschia claudopus]|uniref:Uncharacterized protein n=1 Tax=Favolaschia claudopus TaxID=2862362 RepID=A0AAV9ZY26_9AGAR